MIQGGHTGLPSVYNYPGYYSYDYHQSGTTEIRRVFHSVALVTIGTAH